MGHLTLKITCDICLFFISYSNSEKGSELVLGGVDSSHYTGELKWIPLSSATYYQIKMDRYEEITS